MLRASSFSGQVQVPKIGTRKNGQTGPTTGVTYNAWVAGLARRVPEACDAAVAPKAQEIVLDGRANVGRDFGKSIVACAGVVLASQNRICKPSETI